MAPRKKKAKTKEELRALDNDAAVQYLFGAKVLKAAKKVADEPKKRRSK